MKKQELAAWTADGDVKMDSRTIADFRVGYLDRIIALKEELKNAPDSGTAAAVAAKMAEAYREYGEFMLSQGDRKEWEWAMERADNLSPGLSARQNPED